jgi:hypothetical protein
VENYFVSVSFFVAAAATCSTETAATDFTGVAATSLAADPVEAVDVFKKSNFVLQGSVDVYLSHKLV